MPDLTAILFVIAGIAIAGAVIFFVRNRDKDKPAPAPAPAPVPVAAPQPDVAALQAALQQAIEKLHASTPVPPAPVVPAPVPAAPVVVPPPAVVMAPDGTQPAPVPTPTAPAPDDVKAQWAAYPPYHPQNPANAGKRPVYAGRPGVWGSGQEGDLTGVASGYDKQAFYDNVTGNPAWLHPNNPAYRWDGSRWVRP